MRRILVCLAALGAVGTAAWGQRQITEKEFLDRLSRDHPVLSGARAAVVRADAERQRRAAFEDPTLAFEQEDAGEAAHERTLSLGWTPPLDGRRGVGVEAAEAAIGAAEARTDWALLNARQEMRLAYGDWVVATQRAELLESRLDRLRRVVEAILARADRGEASRLAAGRIELSALELRNLLGAVHAERERALGAVRVWDESISPEDRPVAPQLAPLPGSMTVEERPDLVALSLDLESSLLEEARSRRFVSFPEVTVGWKEVDVVGDEFDGPVFGLSWDIPLGDRGRAERLEARAARAVAEESLHFEKASAEIESEAALKAYAQLLEAWQDSSSVVGRSAWMVDAAVARYELGEDTLTDLMDTLRAVLLAQLADVELYARALEAQRNLELALGRPVVDGGAR